ncbi:Gfo/Idh/MocA family protein [Pararoseomonas indoligenes]|uniref:Gfo/Idh/MocA family protein n=1 Tax=Roseomonas indoligenes TaxID=2820811 RepID=UPI001FD848A0|nr:Gfo/Idh/MocA family oxidoreductase [Pararoseomonas indoligenes]
MSDTEHPIRPTGPGTPEGPALPAAAPAALPPPSSIDRGGVEDGAVVFENWRGEADKPAPPPPAPMPPGKRVGFAIMGLGRLTLEEVLPAFAACKAARPVALVSGSPEKARVVAAQYGIAAESVYGYHEVERLSENPEVQAVYVVTPNGLHRDHVLAVAKAGKHVLCEKPMANTSAEAREMVEACRAAGVRLMIAYRCQYEPFNRELVRLVRSGELGRPRILEATNTQVQGPADQWRLKAPLAGGGALPDIGLYCLNGVRAVLGEEPVEVFARIVNPEGDGRYGDIDETTVFMLRFPSGAIANCATSYGAHESKDLRVRLERGWIDLENAFAYRGQRMRVARRKGDNEAVEEMRLGAKDQFALEIDHFAECILEGREPRTPGEEGVQDQLLMEAIYRSAREGVPVAIPPVKGIDAFRGRETG